ncbi:Transcription factor bHLH155 [Euphorbia peplus]|nr:Transcription factor bHLH155 [Euphorbia peplus]
MGTTQLQNILRSLCFNTEWKYAVFWKLKHRARMVLTLEDAYYDSCEQHSSLENKSFRETIEKMCHGHYLHDPLGLAVAKMSYHVYSLGDGVVGQVAVTGKYRWIVADKHVTSSISSLEFSDGWQSQFSAGIKTVIVVAVVPYGVVQLGSFNKVAEDVKLVSHIKQVFSSFQDSSVRNLTTSLQYSMKNASYLPDILAKGLDMESEVTPDCLSSLDKATVKGGPEYQLPMFPYLPKQGDNSSYFCSIPSMYQSRAVEAVNRHGGCGVSIPLNDENVNLLHIRSNTSYSGQQNPINLVDHHPFGGKKDPSGGSESNLTPHLNNSTKDGTDFCDVLPTEKFNTDLVNFPPDLLDSIVCGGPRSDGIDIYVNGAPNMPESSNINLKKDMESKLEYQGESSGHIGDPNTFLKFSAGFELHEALGPAFSKGCLYFDSEAEKTQSKNIVEVPEEKNISDTTGDSGSENLLEAVVGNVCYSGSDWKSEKSASKSVQSMLTAEQMDDPSSQFEHIIHSAGYSINQRSVIQEDTQRCSSSTGVLSSKGFSSACPSACSEQFDRHSEPAKGNKKRARPGENCRPRPRDRQLIQDRIKELRELVPSGAKCSIDSLLERTIKHMLFMESITKHADKLNKCAESKMHQKGADTSNYEKGSSWAVEVGGHLKVSSIIVENLNKNGQMLVEMLCEECSHFLEIAEAIRSLGLTILKGITEEHGDKTWICFMVEGQNNKVMHRMDILWSLVQILQPKTSSN